MVAPVLHSIYLAHGAADAESAATVRRRLLDHGFVTSDRPSGRDGIWEEIRDRIAECEFLVVLATEPFLQSSSFIAEWSMGFAWQKPTYVLLRDLPKHALPPLLAEAPIFSWDRMDAMIEQIERDRLRLSPEEAAWLQDWYVATKIPVDRLLQHPVDLAKLATRFDKAWHRRIAPERLARELLTMRKRGELARTTRSRT